MLADTNSLARTLEQSISKAKTIRDANFLDKLQGKTLRGLDARYYVSMYLCIYVSMCLCIFESMYL